MIAVCLYHVTHHAGRPVTANHVLGMVDASVGINIVVDAVKVLHPDLHSTRRSCSLPRLADTIRCSLAVRATEDPTSFLGSRASATVAAACSAPW